MGVGKSLDAIIAEAFRALGCEPWSAAGGSTTGWSKQSDFQRCPWRYQLKHELGATPLLAGAVSEALGVGSVGHLLLAAHYAQLLPDARYPGWRSNVPDPYVLLQALGDAGLPMAISTVVEQCFNAYVERWSNEDIRPMAVELSAGDQSFHTSRFDLVFYTEDGIHDGLWIGEHKFLKYGTDLEEYNLHGEVIGEALSFQLSELDQFFGLPLNGVCLNVIFKPDSKHLPTCKRVWLHPTPEALERYANDRSYWLQILLDCKRRKVWPRALEGCHRRNRLCRYFAHCRDLDDSQLKFPGDAPVSPEGFEE